MIAIFRSASMNRRYFCIFTDHSYADPLPGFAESSRWEKNKRKCSVAGEKWPRFDVKMDEKSGNPK